MAKKLLLSTRKGLFIYEKNNDGWEFVRLAFEGVPISISYYEPNSKRLWACLDHGHWAQKISFSDDFGENWTEVEAPKYPEDAMINPEKAATLKYLWSFSSTSDKLLIGTEPGGLFESDLDGKNFELNTGLWDHPSRLEKWQGGGRDNPGIHSIVVDPRDENRIVIGISVAGVFETSDGGKSWTPKNKGLKAEFLPDPNAEIGHDPHIIEICKSNPDYIWQQNHCGVFKSTNGGELWEDVSQKGGPVDFGFVVNVDENDGNIAYVVPGKADMNRVAFNNKLSVYKTIDGGKSWSEKDSGLPQEKAFDIVYRHSMSNCYEDIVFGTTTGNVFFSEDHGESWNVLSNYLPMVYAVKILDL